VIEVESSFSQIASSVFDGENYQFWAMKILDYNYIYIYIYIYIYMLCFQFILLVWRQSQEYYMFFSLRNIYQRQS